MNEKLYGEDIDVKKLYGGFDLFRLEMHFNRIIFYMGLDNKLTKVKEEAKLMTQKNWNDFLNRNFKKGKNKDYEIFIRYYNN